MISHSFSPGLYNEPSICYVLPGVRTSLFSHYLVVGRPLFYQYCFQLNPSSSSLFRQSISWCSTISLGQMSTHQYCPYMEFIQCVQYSLWVSSQDYVSLLCWQGQYYALVNFILASKKLAKESTTLSLVVTRIFFREGGRGVPGLADCSLRLHFFISIGRGIRSPFWVDNLSVPRWMALSPAFLFSSSNLFLLSS